MKKGLDLCHSCVIVGYIFSTQDFLQGAPTLYVAIFFQKKPSISFSSTNAVEQLFRNE